MTAKKSAKTGKEFKKKLEKGILQNIYPCWGFNAQEY